MDLLAKVSHPFSVYFILKKQGIRGRRRRIILSYAS